MSGGEAWHMEHRELRAALKARIQHSITSATTARRTVENPERAAEYAVDALFEYADGCDLIRRLAAHIDGTIGA